MAVSKDVEFVGDVKISVVKVGGGYAVSRSDVYDRVFLNQKTGKPFATHTDAIDGVQDMKFQMVYRDYEQYRKTRTFFNSLKEERDKYFGYITSVSLVPSVCKQ